MSAPAVHRISLVRSRVRACAGLAAVMAGLAACGGSGGPSGPEPLPPPLTAGPPAEGKPLFAFKAGLDQAEQIWLWMEDDRRHLVSTWPPDDPVTSIGRSTAGYSEGLGRFGPVRFDHSRRFLLTSERVRDGARRVRQPSRRFVSYELATGNLVATGPMTDWIPEILTTPTTTMVVAPVVGRAPGKPWLYSVVEGKLVAAPGAAEIVAPDSQTSYAADVGETVVLSVGRLVIQRTQGKWHTIDGLDTDWYWQLTAAPSQDAACLIGRQPGSSTPPATFLLEEKGLRPLPCQGQARSCTFSPDGQLLYLQGCVQPVVDRALGTRPAADVALYPGAHVRSAGGSVRTLGSISVAGAAAGTTRPVITAFDWQTLTTSPMPALAGQSLPDACAIISIDTPAAGTGIAVVRTHCGCIDCYDGSAYALDLAAEKLYLIHDRGEALIYGAAVLGRAVVTTMTGSQIRPTQTDGVPMLFWSDATGTRTVGPVPEVKGLLHNPVGF